MFRSLSSKVSTRGADIIKKESARSEVTKVIRDFLIESFGHQGSKIPFEARAERGSVYVNTKSKPVANEIIFKAKGLYKTLKKNNIPCTKLIVS